MEIKTLIKRCIRIFYISKKPTSEELNEVIKMTGIGMILIGLIGLVFSIVFNLG
ncbi:MAG: protein translocase SEC61 complex subunit gamma [Candidatus Micrarchaeia archaeon]|jgi:protein translocase SEC61 complex gamma subunit